jgi:DNA-binding MarR family transcriptional regulator
MKQIRFDAYVLETLMADLVGHDRQPSAFLVYLCLWQLSRRSRTRTVQVSYRDLARDTGLSKASVQAAVAALERRALIASRHASVTAVPKYTVLRPWIRHRPASAR